MSAPPPEARLAHLEGAFLQVDRRLESLERMTVSRFDQRFNWLIGIVMTSWISTILTILLHR